MSVAGDILLLRDEPVGQYLIPEAEFWARFVVQTEDTAEGYDSDDWTLATVKPLPAIGNLDNFLQTFWIGGARSGITTGKRDTRLTGIYYLVQ
jgi:hypothetical protein